MKVSDKIAELVDARVKELSKDMVNVTETQESRDNAVATEFFKAMASKDAGAIAAAQEAVRKQYKEKAQTIGTDAEGGILVPLTVDSNVRQELEYISPLRQIARVIANAPAKLALPRAEGGDAYWVEEAAVIPATAVTFSRTILEPHKLASRIPGITVEFLQDVAVNPSARALLENRLATAASLEENNAFVNGDGSNQPWGFRSSAVTPGTVAAGATYSWQDLVRLKYALPAAYRDLGVFVMPSAAMAGVEGWKDGNGAPVYRESIAVDKPATLLGRPVYIVDEIPTNLGAGTNETEVWYGVFSDYVIGDRMPTTFDLGTSNDDFDRAQYTLRMIKRVGGIPTSNRFAKLTGVPTAIAQD